MTFRQFCYALAAVAKAVVRLVIRKNGEYTCHDALACWRKRGLAGIAVRMEDKMQRYSAFVDHGGVTEAAWRELLMDIAGYALCALVWLEHGDDPMVR